MSVGDVLVNKHLRPLFREKALIKSNYIARSLTGTPEQQELSPASTHEGFRAGRRLIRFGFSTTYTLSIPQKGTETFDLYQDGKLEMRFKQHWHPYYALPRHYRMVLSLFGVTAESHSAIKIKTFMNKFSPGHFRSDLTAEEVVNALKRTKTKEDQIALMEVIGFTNDEISERLHFVKDIPLYEDISKADEYSSVPDIVKSCAVTVAKRILFKIAPSSYDQIEDPEISNVIMSHFISLIVDEMNIACSLH